MHLAAVAARVFTESRPALEKAVAGGKSASVRAAAVGALAALAYVAGEEPDDTDEVLALLAALWQNGARWEKTLAACTRVQATMLHLCGLQYQGGLGEKP